MTLRWKALFAIGGLVGLGILLIFVVANGIVLRDFRDLQQTQIQQQFLQAESALNAEVAELQRILLDWSAWDDSYQFVLDRNENYLESNLLDTTFDDPGLRLNAIIFLNSAGEVVFSRGFDFVSDTAINVPGGLLERFGNPAQPLPIPLGVSGLLETADGIALVAAAPIVNSAAEGPARGTLIMARILAPIEIERLAGRAGVELALTALAQTANEVDESEALPNFGSDLISMSAPLLDLDGRSIANLNVTVLATIMQSGRSTIVTFNWIIALTGLLLAFLAIMVMEFLVTRRLSLLNRKVEEVAGGSDQSVLLPGNDELSILSRRIDEMISELRAAEEQRIHSERLRVAGELTAGVSHNLNNMLNGIIGPAELLGRTVTGEKESKLLAIIQHSGAKAARLVEQLNQVVRPHNRSSNEIFDVNLAVREALQIAGPRWRDEAQLRGMKIRVIDDLYEVPNIRGNEGSLVDVLINLLFNAVDAMPEGGTIGIHTYNDAAGVTIAVTDTGIGMSEEIKKRAFEPFFTTKVTVGTGLGLATAKATVEAWGGTINLKSQTGVGTEFKLCFPPVSERVSVVKPVQRVPPSGHRRLLVVDDNSDVRDTLLLLLAGNEVVCAASGKEGIEQATHMMFDAVLVDLGLPDIAGDQVAAKIRELQPGIATVMVSGWQLPEGDPRLANFDRYVVKPINSKDQILAVIEEALSTVKSS